MKKDKTKVEMINDLSDFLHKAFCVEGETKFVKLLKPTPEFNCDGSLFQMEDKTRGLFYVALYKPL